ncbi:MAG: TPM domain-containing protein, partial [Deltaproteobacteria bacterium]
MIKFFLIFLFSFNLNAKEVPKLLGPVMDQAGLIRNEIKLALTKRLKEFKAETGNQVQILTIKSLEGESIEGYSIKVVDKWKLGSEKADNGILFLISSKDRRMRIEVGQGLEGVLPDALVGRITDTVRIDFKKGHYEQGIVHGTSLILSAIKGNLEGIVPRKKHLDFAFYVPLVFVILWLWLTFFRPVWLIPIL